MAVNKEFGRNAGPPVRTVTMAERLMILRQLDKTPAPQQHLVPSGTLRTEAENRHKTLLTRRLEHINRRLLVADVGMNRNAQKAFNKHRAKSGFNAKAHDQERTR